VRVVRVRTNQFQQNRTKTAVVVGQGGEQRGAARVGKGRQKTGRSAVGGARNNPSAQQQRRGVRETSWFKTV